MEQIHIKHTSKVRKKLVQEAATWIGTPYKYGGIDRIDGTDCSGFVLMVYKNIIGEKLPRNSAKQAEFCIPIDATDIKAGDLVFFATGKDPHKVSHVGIVLDDENFIHASTSKGVVVSKLSSNYYIQRFRMFGRTPGMKKL
ncbi:MAG: C40 family peptidase [Muribaculaceae bacterium]|nr:C40 family peptidase [Muribaculaceae bacterium]